MSSNQVCVCVCVVGAVSAPVQLGEGVMMCVWCIQSYYDEDEANMEEIFAAMDQMVCAHICVSVSECVRRSTWSVAGVQCRAVMRCGV